MIQNILSGFASLYNANLKMSLYLARTTLN